MPNGRQLKNNAVPSILKLCRKVKMYISNIKIDIVKGGMLLYFRIEYQIPVVNFQI
jgi:hypothetical protein